MILVNSSSSSFPVVHYV